MVVVSVFDLLLLLSKFSFFSNVAGTGVGFDQAFISNQISAITLPKKNKLLLLACVKRLHLYKVFTDIEKAEKKFILFAVNLVFLAVPRYNSTGLNTIFLL